MSKRPPTGLASMTRGILRWAEQQGIETNRVIAPVAREQLAATGDDGRISRELHESIWQSVGDAVADPGFGLNSASAILEASSFGLVGMLAMTSDTVGASIARSVKYSRVLKDDLDVRMRVGDDLVVELWTPQPMTRAMADASVYAFLHFCEAWTGNVVTPRAVFLRHARPADASAYDRFGCAVHFAQPTDAIVFDREVATVPLTTARPEVASYLERVAESWMVERHAAHGLRARVYATVREAITEGTCDADLVARRLGTSTRTLQRGLRAEGLSYRQVVDEVRWSLAAPLVAASDLSLEQVAERLGYADGKAFRRAFHRWAGVAPVVLRRAQRDGE